MYSVDVPNNVEEYQEICVGNKTFYKLKRKDTVVGSSRKRRYSDQFKNPVFIQKDINRKLKMIKKFKENNGDLEELIERWKECISECISMLKNEHDVSPLTIFKSFNLRKHGFDIHEHGICEEDLLDRNTEKNY